MAVATVPGAASTSLLELLTGPPRRTDVLVVFPAAIYLDVETADTATGSPHRIVASIVTPEALRLPCSVVVAAQPDLMAWARGTATVTIGDGGIQLPGATIVVGRWWRPPRPRAIEPTPTLGPAALLLASMLPPLPPELVEPVRHLQAALATDAADEVASAARHLIGLGPGLTPAGDDVVAALLLTLTASPCTKLLAREVVPDAPATTSLSATLLRDAARGEGLPQVVDLVDAMVSAPSRGALKPRVASLLRVGSSSGTALAHGVRLGLGTIAARSDLLTPTCEVGR